MNKNFTIIIFTEGKVGSIVRITTMISRRLMHIENITVVPSGVTGIYRFEMVINETDETIRKLVLQIDKQVDVFKTFYHTNESIVWKDQESYFNNELIHLHTKNEAAAVEV